MWQRSKHFVDTVGARPTNWLADLSASLVVFLVALPLCMGIAIASGMPASAGLTTGIVGGLAVALIAGSPLQVSGPAAGLTVVVFTTVEDIGPQGLAVAVFLAGALQLLAGIVRIGRWFRAVPPAVIEGMLAGIGVLIVAGQLHVMLGHKPHAHGLENLKAIPDSFGLIWHDDGGLSKHFVELVAGVLTLAVIVGWAKYAPKALKSIPGALLAVVGVSYLAWQMQWNIERVSVPANLLKELHQLSPADLPLFLDPTVLGAGLVLAIIASAESLLCAGAVDQMHTGPRTKFDRELGAQGVGNLICGLLGALPMTGVIVRSAANVQAGGKSRLSAWLHGLWLLALVLAAPGLLSMIPKASLAGVLVYTGLKLVSLKNFRKFLRVGHWEAMIFTITAAVVVGVDLLAGVAVGLSLALVRLAWRLSEVDVVANRIDDETVVVISGVATFVRIPKVAKRLEAVPAGARVRIDTGRLYFMDHAALEMFEAWARQHEATGGDVTWVGRSLHEVFHVGHGLKNGSAENQAAPK